MKDWQKNVLLLLVTLLVCLFLFEIALRLVSFPAYGFQEGVFVRDPHTGYRLTPNYEGVQSIYGRTFELRTNEKGLRDDREYTYKKPENVTRVVLLGDSYAFGNGMNVEDTFPEVLREVYKERSIELINLGIPGYGINNEAVLFLEEGVRYDPDIVIVQFMNNDWGTHPVVFEENGEIAVNESFSLPVNKQGLLADDQGFPRNVHVWLLYNVRSYSFVYTKSRLVLDNLISSYWGGRGVPAYFLQSSSEEFLEAQRGYEELLRMIQLSSDAEVVVFIGPFTEDLYSSDDIQEFYGVSYEVDPLQAKNAVKESAERLGIQVIEVTSDDPSIYLIVDNHWNEKGHEIVADGLYVGLEGVILEAKSRDKFINR